ncbi:hypothetical protein F4805DRAFT_290305 [Annulohypoxylon moriforme]|nr:hypothetical protein F4805DRAFT_290305 [Annulohypoxylon moriforme]
MDRVIPIIDSQCTILEDEANETKFHLFGLLPPELRREIYILATPPRVVCVREVGFESDAWNDKFDEFWETCRTTPIQFSLHPDLTYFAHTWVPRIESRLRSHDQPCLEAYGFTSTKSRYQPWVPTDDTPEIPSTWLADYPDTAWTMSRSASLCSSAPIPPFLHVCSESREMLQSYGYQLAFGTRTTGPQTWFHFERDTLFIDSGPTNIENVLVDGPWDISLFRPMDLQRVKKLALSGGFRVLWDPIIGTSEILRLVPNLNDLFMVVWDPDDNMDNMLLANNDDKPTNNVCVPVDELDFLPFLSWHDSDEENHTIYQRMKVFKRQNGSGSNSGQSPYFDHEADRFRKILYDDRPKLMSATRHGPRHQWNVPRVQFVHVCSLDQAKHLFIRRRQFWNRFNTTKNRLARGRISRLQAAKEGNGELPTYIDVGEAFLRAHEPDEDEKLQFYFAHYSLYYERQLDFTLPIRNEELWWLTEAVVLPPRFDIL